MGSIGDDQLVALSGYTGTIQDRIRAALVNPPTETGTIDDLGGYLGRTVFWSSPADETNLVGWYQPSGLNISTPNITSWTDSSSAGNDLDQLPATKPQDTGSINSIQCAKFASTTYAATGAVAYSQPMTVLIVARDDNALNVRNLFSGHTTNDGTRKSGGTTATNWLFNWGSDLNITYTRDTSPHVFSVIINGASSAFYVDGTQIGTGNMGSSAFQRINLGGLFAGFQGWEGDIAEAVFLNEVADATTHNRNGQYLADIYGITWNAVS